MAQIKPPAQEKKRNKRGYYRVGDKQVPSVTKVIGACLAKPSLRYWYAKVGKSEASRISAKAKSFGSAMHKMLAEYIESGQQPMEDTMASNIKKSWRAWKNWWDQNEIKTERVEEVVSCNTHAGTCDLVGEGMVIDWKFSSGIYDSYKIQLGAYAEMLGVSKGKIVRIDKDEDNIEVLTMGKEELEDASEVFNHLLGVFNWKNQ